MVIYWEGDFYVRRVAGFGARTTPGAFRQLADLTRAILKYRIGRGIEILKQTDDFIVIRFTPNVEEKEVLLEMDTLGWQLQGEKGFGCTRRFTHAGLEFYLDARTITLQERKQLKYLEAVNRALKKGGANLEVAEQLVGYLSYVCLILKDRRCYLNTLYSFRRKLQNADKPFVQLPFFRNVREPLEIWRKILSNPPIFTHLNFPSVTSSLEVYSDASNLGLGYLIRDGDETFAEFFPLVEGWREKFKADIGPAEAWAVEAALKAAISRGAKEVTVVVSCNNKGVVDAWKKGWSRSPLTNAAFRRLVRLKQEYGLRLRIIYIPTSINPADEVSRGVERPEWRRRTRLVKL